MFLIKIKEHIQYPKILLLTFSILMAYFLFRMGVMDGLSDRLNGYGYISIYVAGMLFAYGFTAPIAAAFLISMAPEINIYFGALVAGLGAGTSDLLIFTFVRSSFQDEFDKLRATATFQKIYELFHRHFSDKAKEYVLWTLAGFMLASPLPDEFGVTLVSGFTQIKKNLFTLIAIALNTVGIFILLALTQ